ncbi:MAG TPA: hypothetical protein VHT72_07415 [Puia sp.]|nr:hypothetical protein [Puia sp.]
MKEDQTWQNKELAAELFLSPSEILLSLSRSEAAGLIDYPQSKKVYRQAIWEFIEHGLRYVFPAIPGTIVNGTYTAHSHPFMKTKFPSEENYVWPDGRGKDRGLAIEPLLEEQVKAAAADPSFYRMMALVDVLRVGRAREKTIAADELRNIIL